jgi:hypothetical protein
MFSIKFEDNMKHINTISGLNSGFLEWEIRWYMRKALTRDWENICGNAG